MEVWQIFTCFTMHIAVKVSHWYVELYEFVNLFMIFNGIKRKTPDAYQLLWLLKKKLMKYTLPSNRICWYVFLRFIHIVHCNGNHQTLVETTIFECKIITHLWFMHYCLSYDSIIMKRLFKQHLYWRYI